METKTRSEKRTLPTSKIRQLIDLAVIKKLRSLQIGDIVIVPYYEPPGLQAPTVPTKNGKPLTPREREDLILFGPEATVDE